MYFLYLLLLCYNSILLTPASTYVVLAANLNDFQSLAKKYVPKNLVGQIKAMVLENGHKYYKEPLQDDEQVDGTVEYLDDSQQDDSYDEVTREFTIKQRPKNIYQSKKAPIVALAEMSSPIAPPVLTIDDIVEKVKQRLFQKVLYRSVNAQANPQAGDSLAYKNFPKKSIKVSEAKAQVANPVYKSVPMKVIKEEVQFEATYEDLLDKALQPRMQYSGQYLQSKPVSPKKKFVNAQDGGGVKMVRFVKQFLVPANSNQGHSAYVPQPSTVLQPMQQVSLGQQPSIVQHSNLEPQLSLMQQPSMVQKPLYTQLDQQANVHQSTIMKQLILLQQQIEQIYRTVQQKELKNKLPKSPTALGIPQLSIEAVEANFEILPSSVANVKTNDGNEDQAEPSKAEVDESVLSEETTESSTKALTVPGTVDNEQFTEENVVAQDSAITVENDEEKSPAETKESVSNEEVDTKNDLETVKGKDTKLGANAKVHTQEFGNPNVGEPIVAKTYNFDEPIVEAGKEPVNLKWPVDSARKVMLF